MRTSYENENELDLIFYNLSRNLHHFANFIFSPIPNFVLSTRIGEDYGKLSKIRQKIRFLVYAVSHFYSKTNVHKAPTNC